MKKLTLLSLVLSLDIFALKAEEYRPEFQVKVYGNDLDEKDWDSKNIKLIHDDGFVPKKSLLPSIEFRNKTFTESGLMELVRNLDDFELDSIFIKLRQNDESQITNLMMKYPNLNRSVLKKAQALILKGGE